MTAVYLYCIECLLLVKKKTLAISKLFTSTFTGRLWFKKNYEGLKGSS